MTSAPDTCPGCAARIPPSRPLFCEYCGASLPPPASPAVDAGTAEIERRLAAMSSESAPPKSSGSLGMLIVVLLVVGAVLALGCCAFLGVRLAPPR